MAKDILEMDLCKPVCELFSKAGYKVRCEVKDIDITCTKDDEIVAIELKKHLSIELLSQAVKRQKIADIVYVAVPKPKKFSINSKLKDTFHLIRRLELGLIFVSIDENREFCEIVIEPKSFDRAKSIRENNKKREKIVREIEGRCIDLNIGGSTRRKIITSYRESSVFIACCLEKYKKLSPKELKNLGTDSKKTNSILTKNFYGWFERQGKGIYSITERGIKEIKNYDDLKKHYYKKLEDKMDIVLENEFLKVSIAGHGAEVTSIVGKKSGLEYVWSADKKYWGRHAPVLFPIIGKVKNNSYKIDKKTFQLHQHGFARDTDFVPLKESDTKAVFKLRYTEETLKIYPYKFELKITYTLSKDVLDVKYEVKNLDSKDIYFSLGAHPGFSCPFDKSTKFEDYYLEFEKDETADVYKLNEDGLLKRKSEPFFKGENILKLNHDIFKDDALVFKDIKSEKISLKNDKDSKSLTVCFKGFPYLGLWTKADDAQFICIEPWYGHADYEDFDGDFSEKEGTIKLENGKEFKAGLSVKVEE